MGIIIIVPKIVQIWVHSGSQDPAKAEGAGNVLGHKNPSRIKFPTEGELREEIGNSGFLVHIFGCLL